METERKKVAELQEAPEKCASEIRELEEAQEDLVDRKGREEKCVEKVMENIKSETQVSACIEYSLVAERVFCMRVCRGDSLVAKRLHSTALYPTRLLQCISLISTGPAKAED